MTQEEALTILKTGANVFLTGEPGSGKTHTVNAYVAYLRAHNIEPAITASTGIAATHIHGLTIHSWSGIGIKERLSNYDLDKIAANERVANRIMHTSVLIIDEVSMLSSATFSMVDAVCRAVRRSTKPFGGLQVVLVGDFFQLPPVVKRKIFVDEEISNDEFVFEDASKPAPTQFAYNASAWRALNPIICYLEEQHRQEDDNFLEVLSAIRSGEYAARHKAHIESRMVGDASAPGDAVRLFPHNADVDRINAAELQKIDGAERSFTMRSSGAAATVETLKRGCLSPESLVLKVGASVMFTKNNPSGAFVNGTLGKITSFSASGAPVVRTSGGRSIVVEPMEWMIEEDGKVKAKIIQLPLRLAWAITVHKSQGMSLDAAVMDLSRVFEYGQGYVALSRVRTLAGLYLLGINERALMVHPEALEMDEEFREQSNSAKEVFTNMPRRDLNEMQHRFAKASGGIIIDDAE